MSQNSMADCAQDVVKPSISVITKSKTEDATNSRTELSVKDFLSSLKTAYQVHDTLENVLLAGGLTEAVNWLKDKEHDPSRPELSVNDEAGVKNEQDNMEIALVQPDSRESVKQKLDEVLSEGLLDSVLPFLIPPAPTNQNIRSRSQIKITQPADGSKNSQTLLTKKKIAELGKVEHHESSDVEIHVCDEVKQMKRDFYCNQHLLVEKMGYFAEVTKGQRLEDMDISVHCDIGIFEWLMRWMKKDTTLESDWPQLDAQCVVPILVSAAFLQMKPLLQDCLLYCHEHMNEILKCTPSMACINDSVLTKLAAMYTNVELEAIKDKKDKIQSRLYTKMIMSLGEMEPESVRGHWMSLARLYRCKNCLQFVNAQVAQQIPCIASAMALQWDGSIISHHVRCPQWNLNDYICKLYKQKRSSWRRVYWHLWGDCHFLRCTQCNRYFPANQIGWCRYHPDAAQYFTVDTQKAPLPIGRYPCCGERAYRFQLLDNPLDGCQFKEHEVCTKDVRDLAILNLLECYRSLIEEEPPQLMFPERLTRLVMAKEPDACSDKKLHCKESFWWEGFQLIPPRPKFGLLSTFLAEENEHGGIGRTLNPSTTKGEEPHTKLLHGQGDTTCESSDFTDSESSDGGSSSNISVAENSKIGASMRQKNVKKKPENHLWQESMSARSNQDRQRAHEERIMKRMLTAIRQKINWDKTCHRKTGALGGIKNCNYPGGVWARLEAEWREANCPPSNTNGKNKTTTASASIAKFRSNRRF